MGSLDGKTKRANLLLDFFKPVELIKDISHTAGEMIEKKLPSVFGFEKFHPELIGKETTLMSDLEKARETLAPNIPSPNISSIIESDEYKLLPSSKRDAFLKNKQKELDFQFKNNIELEKLRLNKAKEDYKFKEESIKKQLSDISDLRKQHVKDLGNFATATIGGGLIGGGALINSALKARRAERAFKSLAPEMQGLLGDIGTLKEIGAPIRDVKEMMESRLRSTEDVLKNLEIQKTELDKARLERELEKSDTIIGKLQRSSVGQILGPLAGGAILAGGGLAAMKAVETARNLGVPDPSSEIAIRFNLNKVFAIKPNLEHIDRNMLMDYYRMIFRIAPAVGRDPHVAANLLEKMVNFGGADPMLMKELAETQQRLSSEPLRVPLDVANVGTQLFGMVR